MPTPVEDPRIISDETLALRASSGEMPAFEELVRRFQVPLLSFLNRKFPSRRDAEDILQDSFLKAHQSLHLYSSAYPFRTWIFTITYRTAVSHGRKQTLPSNALPAHEISDPRDQPHQTASNGEEAGNLWRTAREVLTEEQYTILWLHYAHDIPAAEIGKILNRSWVSVKTLMHRARKKLAPHLIQIAPQRRPQPKPVPVSSVKKNFQQVTL